MAGHTLQDLGGIIASLDAAGLLARVKSEVDARYELAGVAHRLEGVPRAALFEKVKGQRWPVFTGLFWNRAVIAAFMQCEERALAQRLAEAIRASERASIEPAVVKTGAVQEVTEREVDLGQMPIPEHALKDAGVSLDPVLVLAKNPETGARHASLERFEVAGRNALRIEIGAGSALEAYLAKARRLGRSLWITVNCGVGPALHIAVSAPAEAAPIGRDALAIAAALQGAPVELVPGTESDIEMVAHAMWALECEIIPGESTAHPLVHVRRIHRRGAPVFHTLLPGAETRTPAALFGEAMLLGLLRQQVAGLRDLHLAGRHHALVQLAQPRAGASQRAILAALAALPALRMVTVVDGDVDIRDAEAVAAAVANRLEPASGIVVVGNGAAQRVGFDATQPLQKGSEDERAMFKAVSLVDYDISGASATTDEPSVHIAAAPRMAAAPAPAAGPAPDYDTDRIWQRELAEYRKGQDEKAPAGAPVDVKPASGKDWDENRWWQRELAEMKREPAAKSEAPAQKPASPPKPQPAAPRAAERPAKAEPVRSRPGSSDWDENRWWKRELEEMAHEREKKRESAPAKSQARPAAPSRSAPIRNPEPMRAAEARSNDARSGEDDDGGFFRGDAM